MNTLPGLLLCALCAPAAPVRIVCFGDSTTAPRPALEPYCTLIARPGLETLNRGVPGNTTEAARRRFQTDVLDARPDLVIIQFGLNDSTVDVWKTPPATAPRVSLDRFTENLTYFVERLQQSGARVVLMTFNPLAWTEQLRGLYGRAPYRVDQATGFNKGRDGYLAAIRRIASSHGAALVDINEAFLEYARQPDHSLEDLLPDGMHPNQRGHQQIAARLEPLLRQLSRP